jgi:hypothetical protein
VKLNLRSDGDDADEVKAWPGYIFWGRLRTSTAALIVAFCTLFWVYQTFQPEPTAPPASQVVPPGFIPDPDYTWVPRTQLAPRPTTTTTTTTTPTTTTTDPTDMTTPSLAPGQTPTTTMLGPATLVDPDGAGPLPPQLLTTTPTTTPTTVTATPTTTTAPAPPS